MSPKPLTKGDTMEKGSFTPGPWDLQSPMEDQSGSDVIVASGIKGSFPTICELSYEVPPNERKANARLIAAAPEQHAALKYLSESIRHLLEQKDIHIPSGIGDMLKGWNEDLIEPVIAKAEGRAQG